MSVLSTAAAAEDRRFNAVKQNFTGAHIIADESQLPLFQAILERFTAQYRPKQDPTIEFLVSEMAKSTWQIERLEAVIAKTIAEKGNLCDELRLLTRYVNDHRRGFYRAMKQINEHRRCNINEERLRFKIQVQSDIDRYSAATRRVEVAAKCSETTLFRSDPNGFRHLSQIVRATIPFVSQ